MELDIVSYNDLLNGHSQAANQKLETALLHKGIVGIKNIPDFEEKTRAFIAASRQFSLLAESVKQRYAPDRDAGKTEGYELGAEKFLDHSGKWQTDDKKASFYAYVPDRPINIWPNEVDLKTPYQVLGELIFNTGKILLNVIGINKTVGIHHDLLTGYGRMLHYQKESDLTNENPNWCGAHLDHGVFTGIVPAYYFRQGEEINEPEEAGLYIKASNADHFEKINADDKSILLFQVGEFGQLVSNDRIKATKHFVKKANGEIERFTFALFYSAHDDAMIKSTSILTKDARYAENKTADGSITYKKWQDASYERYRAK